MPEGSLVAIIADEARAALDSEGGQPPPPSSGHTARAEPTLLLFAAHRTQLPGSCWRAWATST